MLDPIRNWDLEADTKWRELSAALHQFRSILVARGIRLVCRKFNSQEQFSSHV
jgi:hypothetical protein